MRGLYYILGGEEGRTPVRCADIGRWGAWMEQSERRVALTQQGDVLVSTVFLGLDHRHIGKGPAILFETMTFRGTTMIDVGGEQRETAASSDGDGEFCRYSSWDDALAGHEAICRRVFGKKTRAEVSTREK